MWAFCTFSVLFLVKTHRYLSLSIPGNLQFQPNVKDPSLGHWVIGKPLLLLPVRFLLCFDYVLVCLFIFVQGLAHTGH